MQNLTFVKYVDVSMGCGGEEDASISFGGGCRPRPSYLPLSVEEVTMGFLSPEEKTGQENHYTWFLPEINQSTRLVKHV